MKKKRGIGGLNMKTEKRKLWNIILSLVIIVTIFMAIGMIQTNVKSGGFAVFVFEWKKDTGSPIYSIDISDGYPTADKVYVVAGSSQNLSVYDGEGNLEWYNDTVHVADFGAYGTSHGVAISGNAEYVVAGDTSGVVHVYDIGGTELWSYDMGTGGAYSVDVSNPLNNENNTAYVVSCCGGNFYVFDAASTPPVSPLWNETISNGTVINVRISENGHWIGVSSSDRRIEFYNNTDPSQYQMMWSYNTEDSIVNIDIGRNGLVVVAGEDDPSDQGTSKVYEFDAGDDWTWGTGDNIPRWSRVEPNDIYAVSVSDSEVVSVLGPPFSVVSGKTWSDNDSEESYYYSPNKIRNWPTGLVWSTDATYDDNSSYNFRLFGCWDKKVYLTSQATDTIIGTYTTNGTVNDVAISFSFINENIYRTRFDYFAAGSADGYLYFFTYAYS